MNWGTTRGGVGRGVIGQGTVGQNVPDYFYCIFKPIRKYFIFKKLRRFAPSKGGDIGVRPVAGPAQGVIGGVIGWGSLSSYLFRAKHTQAEKGGPTPRPPE